MGEHLFKTWPAYVLLAGFAWLVIAMIVSVKKQEKKDEEQKKSQGNK